MKTRAVLSIGNFDGVHRGHAHLIENILQWKRVHQSQFTEHLETTLITFEPHPVEFFRNIKIPRLTNPEQKRNLLERLGIEKIQVLKFNDALAKLDAKHFFEEFICKPHNPAFLAIGYNFHFGKDRSGNPQILKQWCEEKGISAQIFGPVEADGAPISSSRIRELLSQGNLAAASRLLGRNFVMTGTVVHGDKRGRQLGFPTANMLPQDEKGLLKAIPAKGVYLSTSSIGERTFASVTNVGIKPTVKENGGIIVETHLLNFDGDLYEKTLTVEFLDRIRDEKRFASLDELSQQTQADIAFAKGRLGSF